MQGLLGGEDGEVDPRESGVESRTPHDVGDLHGAAVLELGRSVVNVGDPRNTLDAGGLEVLRLDSDQRLAARDHLWANVSTDGSLDRQRPVEDDPTDDRHQDTGDNAFGPEGIAPVLGPDRITL